MRIKSFAFAIVSFILLSLIYPVESAKAVILEEFECFPAVLLLRGSDESNQGVNEFRKTTKNELGEDVPYGPALFRTNGNEGEILRRLLQNFTNYTQVEDTASKVRFIGVDYEALAVPGFPLNNGAQGGKESLDFWDHLLKYDESYRGGAKSVLSIINEDEKRGCNTKYMLVGYSQGVISARIAMNLLNNDTEKIFGSYVIGDPFQKANGAHDPRQKSPANTSYDTYGAGNVGATVLTALAATDPKFLPQDFSGNLSTFSEPLVVTVPEFEEDLIPPSKPLIEHIDSQLDSIAISLNSSDNVGVLEFEIYKDGVLLETVDSSYYYDWPLDPDTAYEYTAVAIDYSGNRSEISEPLIISTLQNSSD